jgi:PII-like signaling protein
VTEDQGTYVLMRVFVDESDRRDGVPLYSAIVEHLRELGCAGATVLKGIEGFGARRELHAARAFDFSNDMPVLIEVIESEDRIEGIVASVRALVAEGLITIERIQVVHAGSSRS